jgi:hypothetical protein
MRRPIARYGLCVGRWDRWGRLNARTGVSGDMSRICACIAWAPGWIVTFQVDRKPIDGAGLCLDHATHVVVLPIEKKSQFQTPDAPAIHEFDTSPDGAALRQGLVSLLATPLFRARGGHGTHGQTRRTV